METLAVIRHNSYVSGSLLSSEVQMRKSHLIQWNEDESLIINRLI